MNPLNISPTQKKRTEKSERLRKYFGEDTPQVHEWNVSDEALDFTNMSDDDIAEYLKHTA